MKKLLLINPVGRRSGYLLSRISNFPPLGLAIIAALTPEEWTVTLLDENFTPFEYEDADLVAITAFTSTINRAYEISSLYREKGIKVVIGGIHASMVPEEVSRYADSAVAGEVEEIWSEVLRDFEEDALKPIYRGNHVDLSQNAVRPKREILDPRYYWNSVETTRGCPFNCTFCSVNRYLGSKYRRRSVEDVLNELEEIKGKRILFTDNNLIGHTKADNERAKQIFRGMIDRKLKKKWWMQASMNIGEDEETIKLAAKAGCAFVFLGLESIDEKVLRDVKKGVNLNLGVENYDRVIRLFHKHGVGVMVGTIMGNDYENSEYYKKFGHYLFHSGLDIIQITVLTPLPGTQLYEEMEKEGRIVYKDFPQDWKRYRLSVIVHKPNGVEVEDIYRANNYIKSKLYSPLGLIYRMIRSFFSMKNIANFSYVLMFNRALKKGWRNSYYFSRFPHQLRIEDAENVQEKVSHGESR